MPPLRRRGRERVFVSEDALSPGRAKRRVSRPLPAGEREEQCYSTFSAFCSSTLSPSDRISLTSTLKLSGMPASKVSSPLTIAS